MNYEFREVEVRVVEPNIVRSERYRLTAHVRHEFKINAAKALGLPISAFSNHTFHHVLPCYLLGTSDPLNLTLIRQRPHQGVHKRIVEQTWDLKPGQTKEIEIAFPTNPWVWDERDFFDEDGNRYVGETVTAKGNWLECLRNEYSVFSPNNAAKIQTYTPS
jgi:hypothetical protein